MTPERRADLAADIVAMRLGVSWAMARVLAEAPDPDGAALASLEAIGELTARRTDWSDDQRVAVVLSYQRLIDDAAALVAGLRRAQKPG